MPGKNSVFLKVWGQPLLHFVVTIVGLLLAIMGVGIWHVLSWIALAYPIYAMVRYGVRFFK